MLLTKLLVDVLVGIKLKAFWLLGQKESGLKDFEKASRLSGELAWNF